MANDLKPPQPWVLARKDKPVLRFGALSEGKEFYNHLRFNGARQPDAVIFGPGGEAWYCRASKESYWGRDDERRRREAVAVEAESGT